MTLASCAAGHTGRDFYSSHRACPELYAYCRICYCAVWCGQLACMGGASHQCYTTSTCMRCQVLYTWWWSRIAAGFIPVQSRVTLKQQSCPGPPPGMQNLTPHACGSDTELLLPHIPYLPGKYIHLSVIAETQASAAQSSVVLLQNQSTHFPQLTFQHLLSARSNTRLMLKLQL